MSTKHKYITDPNILLTYFFEYLAETKKNPIKKQIFVGRDGSERWEERERPITLLGFKNFCRNNYSCVERYFLGEESYKDYEEVAKHIKESCLQDNIEGAMVGIYHSAITARINGLADKTEVKSTNETKNININVIDSGLGIANNEGEIKLD